MARIPLFENQCVRDLAWSCFGENLINDFATPTNTATVQCCHISLTQQRLQWLQQLDQDPTPLLSHLSQLRSTRIGLYFESLWQFFMVHDKDLVLLAHNLQVTHNKKTFGEFDLIYQDNSTGGYYHLELAIKFYLNNSLTANGMKFSNDFHYWLGPNAIDRLDLKTEHLLNHQIQLSSSEAGKAALTLIGIDTISQEIAIKGRLFYPNGMYPDPLFDLLSATHDHSHWIKHSSLKEIFSDKNNWVILDRSEWISPVYQDSQTLSGRVKSNDELVHLLALYFTNNDQPLMICGLERKESHYHEQQRFFVTADSWPEKHQ